MAWVEADVQRERIQQVYGDYKWFYQVLGGGALVLLSVLIESGWYRWDSGYGRTLYTELISIAVTVAIVDRLNQRRATEQLKKRLVCEADSRSNNMAVSAIDWLRAKGWLTGEERLLHDEFLRSANLQGTDLCNANLEDANIPDAIKDYCGSHSPVQESKKPDRAGRLLFLYERGCLVVGSQPLAVISTDGEKTSLLRDAPNTASPLVLSAVYVSCDWLRSNRVPKTPANMVVSPASALSNWFAKPKCVARIRPKATAVLTAKAMVGEEIPCNCGTRLINEVMICTNSLPPAKENTNRTTALMMISAVGTSRSNTAGESSNIMDTPFH